MISQVRRSIFLQLGGVVLLLGIWGGGISCTFFGSPPEGSKTESTKKNPTPATKPETGSPAESSTAKISPSGSMSTESSSGSKSLSVDATSNDKKEIDYQRAFASETRSAVDAIGSAAGRSQIFKCAKGYVDEIKIKGSTQIDSIKFGCSDGSDSKEFGTEPPRDLPVDLTWTSSPSEMDSGDASLLPKKVFQGREGDPSALPAE